MSQTAVLSNVSTKPPVTVFYDGACPLCRREIAFYRDLRGADDVRWVDVATAGDGEVAPGLPADRARARFHVRLPDGRLLDGGRAFAALWRALPAFKPLGVVFGAPGLRWILDRAYDGFLPLRPRLQRWMTRRDTTDDAPALPRWLRAELRSDHAGETGAVWIYRGVLAISRDPEAREFARRHLETESEHREALETVLAPRHRSVLLPLWRVAGWLTGALPALFGRRAIYATVDAVESFVDTHYGAQIDALAGQPEYAELRALLVRCRDDEVAHRDEARGRGGADGPVARAWTWLVGAGSAGAVALARRV